ncbi:DUF805 domain-containing protein [Kineosporia babensis]|uniref:DUF805 domain-containing protein n=1 Tax=Kineosporia babensis TaxID=499548 RepID=A0A9X1SU78_9ACTN|nr:DUF805 domain-containing protein [Kineosporia babensis]
MSFKDAVQTVLTKKYATFSGRARRSELWWFWLFSFVVGIVASIIDQVIGSPIVQAIVTLAFLIPSLAVGARRLHDTGRSGWWQLISIIPLIGFIVLVVFWVQDSHPGENQHGPSPKGGFVPQAGPQPGWGQQPQ